MEAQWNNTLIKKKTTFFLKWKEILQREISAGFTPPCPISKYSRKPVSCQVTNCGSGTSPNVSGGGQAQGGPPECGCPILRILCLGFGA